MAGLDQLQDEYTRLTKTIDEQNRLRDTGSDEYDVETFDRALAERDRVVRSIKEAGGTPGKRPAPQPPPTTGGATPPPTPDRTGSTTTQLERALDTMRSHPPHPGVRLVDEKVVGGTEKELKEQAAWRSEVEQLEHELNAAQADGAWNEAGGPDGFTDADRRAIKDAGNKIDAVQKELDAVNAEIKKNDDLLQGAQSQLEGEKIRGGGPSAGGAAAIAVGARIQGDLRKLHEQKAEITKRLQAAQAALVKIVTARVRAQLEQSGTRVDLPSDRTGQRAVQDAFMRRVYRRLGLPYPAPEGSAVLQSLGGPQSSAPRRRLGLLLVAALIVLVVFAVGALTLWGGDDANTAAGPEPPPKSSEPAPAPTPAAPVLVADATKLSVVYSCARVVHVPLAGFSKSLSHIVMLLLIAGVDGPVPTPATVTVDASGLAPNTAPINGNTAAVPIPIDHFATYPITVISARGPDGVLPVTFKAQDIVVTSAEGPVAGCLPPADALANNRGFENEVAHGLWIGDSRVGTTSATATPAVTPAVPATPSPSGGTAEPDFAAFVQDFDQAHRSHDGAALFNWLDRSTVERYGAKQCRAYLKRVAGSLTGITLVGTTAESWVYTTDGVSTSVPDSTTLAITATLGGSETRTTMHVRAHGDEIAWFTDCGTPLP